MNDKSAILVVDDDTAHRTMLRTLIGGWGYEIAEADDGSTAIERVRERPFDLVLMDIRMLKVSGLEALTEIRGINPALPVIIMTAYSSIETAVGALKSGAYDYLTKPFSFTELLARIESLVRRNRQSAETETVLRVADLEMDLLARTVKRAGQNIDVQPREFRLLEYLMRNAGQVVTRTMLLEKVWDYHFDPQTNVIDVHISRLRAKIDKEFDTPLLQTIRGAGYMLRETA